MSTSSQRPAGSTPFQGFDRQAPSRQIMGDAGSAEALRVLSKANEHIRRRETLTLLNDALKRFGKGDWAGGGELALKALHIDEASAEAWHILGIARDKCHDVASAIACYEASLRLSPENVAVACDLGRLAFRIGETGMAEKFFRFHLSKCPDSVEAVNNLATSLREASKYDEAIALLQTYIPLHPQAPDLWNVLGTVMNATGDLPSAAQFYRETLRLDPEHAQALYNLGSLMNNEKGLKLLERALPKFIDPTLIRSCKLSLAFTNLNMGRLAEGWDWYDARNRDAGSEGVQYVIPRPQWRPGDAVAGQRLFVSAEQGLGDEILFANLLRDLQRDIGPEGRLAIGVEPRLVPLFRRSFPKAEVYRHHTAPHDNRSARIFPEVSSWDDFDAWGLMGDFLGGYRARIEDFPADPAYLTPDPERVAHWRGVLGALNDKPKIGLLWKSLVRHSRRDRYYSPFEAWRPVLDLDGLQFVNLQYGDTSAELEAARAAGIDIWTPPGLDLKDDLDDLAALCVALDAVVSPAVATSNIAGACGARVFLMLPRGSWTTLGTDRFPWYPNTRVLFTASLSDWAPVMKAMAEALSDAFPSAGRTAA
jgi:tetratricopeptide (TPR) repeat protein